MGTSQLQNDIPVELKGYISDPKQVGYQILTNYEVMYWRPLVSNEAWGLYEVLRSFCHDKNNTCHPSINLLTAILGVKDKRAIIGRLKTVNGREHRIPGLIEVLQQHGLVIAKEEGEGPTLRYVFHVNLTPGLLSTEQLCQLPVLLQKKHAELVERCQKAHQEFEGQKGSPNVRHKGNNKGSGKFPQGVGNSHEGGGKFPPKQHPINTTHLTTTVASRDVENNNSGGDATPPPADVVVALREIGLSEKVAQRLAQRYQRERILEKIAYLTFLQKNQPKKVTNPRGWLRRAIEEDYAQPDGYKPEAERQQKTRELAQAQAELEKEYEEVRAQREREREEALAELKETYGTTQKEIDLWAQALAEIEISTTRPNFQAWFPQTHLLSLKDGVATVGVPNLFTREHLEHPKTRALCKRVLDSLAGYPVTLNFAVLQSQEGNGLQPQPGVQQSSTTSI